MSDATLIAANNRQAALIKELTEKLAGLSRYRNLAAASARIAELEAERDVAKASLATCSKGFDAVCKVNSELRAEARAWEKMAREAADRIYELEAEA